MGRNWFLEVAIFCITGIIDSNDLRCGFERDFAALNPFSLSIGGDLLVFAEATNTLFAPGVAYSHRLAGSIEQPRDLAVRHQPGQVTNERYRIQEDTRIVPAGILSLLDVQRRVGSALPMQNGLNDRAIAADDDLVERCAQDALARGRCGGRVRPGTFEIGTELHQLLTLLLAERR